MTRVRPQAWRFHPHLVVLVAVNPEMRGLFSPRSAVPDEAQAALFVGEALRDLMARERETS